MPCKSPHKVMRGIITFGTRTYRAMNSRENNLLDCNASGSRLPLTKNLLCVESRRNDQPFPSGPPTRCHSTNIFFPDLLREPIAALFFCRILRYLKADLCLNYLDSLTLTSTYASPDKP